MSIPSTVKKNIVYSIVSFVLIALFVSPAFKTPMNTICGATFSVALFGWIFEMLLGDSVGHACRQISAWCIRGSFILVIFMSAAGIGFANIAKLFAPT